MALVAFLVLLTLAVLPLPASAWNIPGHMLSAAIAYQVLQQESSQSIEKVKAAAIGSGTRDVSLTRSAG